MLQEPEVSSFRSGVVCFIGNDGAPEICVLRKLVHVSSEPLIGGNQVLCHGWDEGGFLVPLAYTIPSLCPGRSRTGKSMFR